jgi:pyruvate/2-oxoglutarate dehydrogenase complex dihydrolipoamide dehydrogenase (E3) component
MAGRRDLVVIGGGAGGLVVASVAARTGLKVTLVEKSDRLGGDCLHTGCIPSKTLIHAANTVQAARRGVNEGLLDAMPGIDFNAAIDRVHRAIETIQTHDDPERFRGYGCDVRFGKAKFTSPHAVAIDEEVVTARRFVIATGSWPAVPSIPGLEEAGFDTSDTVFSRRELPRELAVIGGGPVGVELAQAFARFGSRVTVVETAARLLPREDPESSTQLRTLLEQEGIRIITDARIMAIHREGTNRQIMLENGTAVECERILVAAGRHPAAQGLGLDAAGVEFGAGGIGVDRRLRTTQKHIHAIGDVCGPYHFTHMAEYQAGIVLANTVFRLPRKTDYRVVPRVVYTDPEIAAVGLTQAEADSRGIKYDVARFPLPRLDRAITDNAGAGFVKVLTGKRRVIGASLVAPRAGDMIHELALAMQVNAKAKDIAELIHAYPTYAQIHRRAILNQQAHLLETRRVRFLVWLLQRLIP